MGAPFNKKNLFAQANGNGTTLATLFTHGTSLKNPDGSAGYGGIVDDIIVDNQDTVQHGINIYRVPNGGSAGATNRIFHDTVPAGAVLTVLGPYKSTDSAFYQVKYDEAKVTTEVSFQVNYHEMS